MTKKQIIITGYRSLNESLYEINGSMFDTVDIGIMLCELYALDPTNSQLIVILDDLTAVANLSEVWVMTGKAGFAQDRVRVYLNGGDKYLPLDTFTPRT